MADTDRIRSNLEKMIGQGAPEADIDMYLASEGYKSAEEWRKAIGVKEPSLGRRALDAVGEGAAAVGDAFKAVDDWSTTRAADMAGGLISLPGVGAKASLWLGRQLGIDPQWLGPQYAKVLESMTEHPTSQQISSDLLAAAGKPRVDLPGGLGKIVDMGAEGALGAIATGGASLPVILAGAGGGMASEGLGQLAQNVAPEWETEARLGGAVLGGVAGSVVPSVVRRGGSVLRPFTKSGQDKIVGAALRDAASDPDAAVINLQKYQIGREAFPDTVPGFKIDAGKASRDPGLMAAADVVPDRIRGLNVQNNNALVTRALDTAGAGGDPRAFIREIARQDAGAAARAQAALDALPPGVDAGTAGRAIQAALRGRYDSLRETRSAVTGPLYAEARNFPDDLPIARLWQHVDSVIADTKGGAQRAARRARGLLFNSDGQPDWSGAGMVRARTEINDMIGKALVGSNERRVLMSIRDEMDNTLATVPAEQQARQTFQAMSRPLDVFDAKKGAPNVAGVIDQNPTGGQLLMASERVPAQFFKPGDTGAATMREFLTANDGNAAAINAMRSHIAEQARAATDPRAFLQRNRPAIDALDPQLSRQLEDVVATRTIREGLQSAPAGRFLNQDIDAAVRSTLSAPDSTRRMQTLRMQVGGNPDATRGLQRAILDDFRLSSSAPVASDATSSPMITAAGASNWLKKNRGAARNVLSDDQVRALDDITKHLGDQAQAVPGRSGSPTFDRLASESILKAVIGRKEVPAWLHPVQKALTLNGIIDIYGGANRQMLDRMMEVITDPAVTAALMKKATPGNAKMAEPLLQSIGRGTAYPAATSVERATP